MQSITNIFFTDITTNASQYCLTHLKAYQNNFKHGIVKKIWQIDPGVYELKVRNEYSDINNLKEFAKSKKQLISIDYPPDMNIEYSDLFIRLTNKNIAQFAPLNQKYIVTPQCKFQDFRDFIKQFNWNKRYMSNHVVGIGNLCRIMNPNDFTDKLFHYLNNNVIGIRYHFFGLAKKLIVKYLKNPNFYWSIDSTKWTKAVTQIFKKQNGVCCRKYNRDKYFLEYLKELRKNGIEIEG